MAERADRHRLYQRAVQGVEAEIDFVDEVFRTLRGRKARRLREDFCGTAFTSCEWVRRRRDNIAIGVDIDPQVLEWGRSHNIARLEPRIARRLELVCGDVRSVVTEPIEVVLAMNFSYWCFKERAGMRAYFAHVREQLAREGLLILDAYGGYDAHRVMTERTDHRNFTYVWDQAYYNPIDGNVINHIDFRFPDGSRLRRAFTYDWRLWTLPELREILEEAGFKRSIVYWQGSEEDEDEFVATERGEPDAGWICHIVAEK
jgi:SAM-dependent methyltransferase